MPLDDSLVFSDTPPSPIQFEAASFGTRFRGFLQARLFYVWVAEVIVAIVAESTLGLSNSLVAVTVGVCIYGTARYASRGQKSEVISSPLLLLNESGDYATTLSVYRQSALQCTEEIGRASVALNIGYVLRRSGQFTAALAQFLEVQKLGIQRLEPVLASNLTFVYLLLGDMEKAKKYLSPKPLFAGATHAVYWARSENLDALQQLPTPKVSWTAKELQTHEIHVVNLMKAFTDHDKKRRTLHLGLARQSFTGEFDYLVENWPELAAFLAKHRETLAPPPSPLPIARLVSKN